MQIVRSRVRLKDKEDEAKPLSIYTFVAWKTRKHLTSMQSLLSDVGDVLPFLFTVLDD